MRIVEKIWDSKPIVSVALWPLALIFWALSTVRKKILKRSKKTETTVPVIVIGNISVGGTGKTPILLELAHFIISHGFKVGIVSRGYGGKDASYPMSVLPDSDVAEVGDEALMLAQSISVPVVVDPDRCRALKALVDLNEIDVVLSDDGLQHYQLKRTMEIVVVDGDRLFGNKFFLPAGPLRESISRLNTVDFVLTNGSNDQLNIVKAEAECFDNFDGSLFFNSIVKPLFFRNLLNNDRRPFAGAPFKIGSELQVISGIGSPQRFYNLLQELPYGLKIFEFPDHHPFVRKDLERAGVDFFQPVVMTDKDAVKCATFAEENFWSLVVKPELDSKFLNAFMKGLAKAIH
tara:strand:+ start:127 stop:1167 length:1041 start_codon:yes stop_codon:yes gene_type:complete